MRQRLDTIITQLTFVVGAILLSLMVVQITLNAFLRATMKMPLTGTIEIVSNYYMVGFSFLPMALAYIRGRHVEANFLHRHMPAIFQTIANWISRLLTLGIIGLIMMQSVRDALEKTAVRAYAIAGTSEIPIWICYWILPFSFALLLLVVLVFPQPRDNELPEVVS